MWLTSPCPTQSEEREGLKCGSHHRVPDSEEREGLKCGSHHRVPDRVRRGRA